MKFPPNEESQKFWEAFRACAEENRVSPDRSSFYVRWAQAFARFLPEKLLQDRSGKDIQAFLADLAQRQGVADWQVRQANHALKILYETFLPHYASEKTPHPSPNGRETIAKRGEFRDSVLPGEVERRFSSLVEALKTEIRTRHYSYRTETSYLDWMRRFIAFHDYTVPRGPRCCCVGAGRILSIWQWSGRYRQARRTRPLMRSSFFTKMSCGSRSGKWMSLPGPSGRRGCRRL